MQGPDGSLIYDKTGSNAATGILVSLSDGQLKLEIGSITVKVKVTATVPSPPLEPYDQEMTFGEFIVPASPDPNHQAGSWQDPSFETAEIGAKRTLAWDLTRKRGS